MKDVQCNKTSNITLPRWNTEKLQTPDHLETVVLTKTSGICRSEI
jgi:hypothetical protein